MYARKCSVTGKGMNEGYVIRDSYAIDLDSANILAQQYGYDEYEYNDECYYTEWNVNDEILSGENEFYTETGEIITPNS